MQLGALAGRYFRHDPNTAIFKLRQFAELLSKRIAAHHALYRDEREAFEETLRRLSYERIIPKEAADVFHALRKAGNKAAHEVKGNHTDALSALSSIAPMANSPNSSLGRLSRRLSPSMRVALRDKIDGLRERVAESEDATSRARREAEEHARARESVEQRLAREVEERVPARRRERSHAIGGQCHAS